MEHRWLLQIALVAILITEKETHPYQSCWTNPKCGREINVDHEVKSLNCADVNLENLHLEQLMQGDCSYHLLQNLTIASCNINYLGTNVFQQTPNLSLLNLSYNYLTSLGDNIFNNLSKVEEIDLSHNKLHSLGDERLFKDQINLKKLTLCFNELSNLSPKAFLYLQKVETINLSSNKLSALPKDLFKTQYKLKNLFLGSNRLKELDSRLFSELNLLEVIDLSNNTLETFAKELLLSQNNLKSLNLSYNDINYLWPESFSNLTNVEVIDLSGNKLATLADKLLLSQYKLKTLIIKNNELSKLSVNTLSSLSLKYLDLSGNSFLCTCEIIDIIQWCKKNNLARNAKCQKLKSDNKILWSKFHETYSCTNSISSGVIPTLIENSVSTQNTDEKMSGTLNQVTVTVVIIFTALQLVFCSVVVMLYFRRRNRSTYLQNTGNRHDEIVSSEAGSRNINQYDYISPTANVYQAFAPELPSRPSANICDETSNQNDENSSVIYDDRYYGVLAKPKVSVTLTDSTAAKIGEMVESFNATEKLEPDLKERARSKSQTMKTQPVLEETVTSAVSKPEISRILSKKKADDIVYLTHDDVKNKFSERKTVKDGAPSLVVTNSLYCE